MKNQLIHLKHFLTSIGFFSLFLICIGDEARADSINNAENIIFRNKKIKWVKYDGFKKNKEIVFEKVEKQNEESGESPLVAAKKINEKEKKAIKKAENKNEELSESPLVASKKINEKEKKSD